MRKTTMKKMKPFMLLAFFTVLLLIATACGQTEQENGTDDNPPVSGEGDGVTEDGEEGVTEDEEEEGANEDDISPVAPEEKDSVKKTINLYFSDNDLMNMYSVTREIEAENEEELVKEALHAWMDGPEQEGLQNIMPPDVVVESVTITNGIAEVSFSGEIKNANLGSSGELFLLDQLALIMQQFGADATQVLVEGEIEESLLGHVSTDEPYAAPNPEDYEEWSS
ncbi:GerMN domain-containing protein [Bacillus horti]|uniref:GerMN domain-containing protein n=1 Tax=Caldalkalibacillus horti TaxID=77523 RepID=A0ABT9VZ29_9BACI|nr:GerMN domain-containing protein [Bacillus horti]MDQ0166253.1 hypothetical protein [Bacillus horti]